MNWSDIEFAIEVGAEADIDAKILVDGARYYLVKDYENVEEIDAKRIKKITGIGIRELKRRFRDDEYFIMMPKESEFWHESFEELTEEDGIGIYFEKDHEQLVKDGVYAEEMNIIKKE